jgi:hypothetical protein
MEHLFIRMFTDFRPCKTNGCPKKWSIAGFPFPPRISNLLKPRGVIWDFYIEVTHSNPNGTTIFALPIMAVVFTHIRAFNRGTESIDGLLHGWMVEWLNEILCWYSYIIRVTNFGPNNQSLFRIEQPSPTTTDQGETPVSSAMVKFLWDKWGPGPGRRHHHHHNPLAILQICGMAIDSLTPHIKWITILNTHMAHMSSYMYVIPKMMALWVPILSGRPSHVFIMAQTAHDTMFPQPVDYTMINLCKI